MAIECRYSFVVHVSSTVDSNQSDFDFDFDSHSMGSNLNQSPNSKYRCHKLFGCNSKPVQTHLIVDNTLCKLSGSRQFVDNYKLRIGAPTFRVPFGRLSKHIGFVRQRGKSTSLSLSLSLSLPLFNLITLSLLCAAQTVCHLLALWCKCPNKYILSSLAKG